MGFVFLPGGFGTLDEFFELITLVQTERIQRFPLVLIGRRYWEGLLRWMRTTVEGGGFISPGDLDLATVVDTAAEATTLILDYHRRVGPPRRWPGPSREHHGRAGDDMKVHRQCTVSGRPDAGPGGDAGDGEC